MRKLTTSLFLFTLCLSTAAFADSGGYSVGGNRAGGLLGSGNVTSTETESSRNPAFGSGAGIASAGQLGSGAALETPAMGTSGTSVISPLQAAVFLAVRILLTI